MSHYPLIRCVCPGTNSASLSALTGVHNQRLRQALKVVAQQRTSLEIVTLDANTLYRDAITNPVKFGFTNVSDACLSNGHRCGNPDQFLFWDGIHPTTAAHRILGENAFKALAAERLTALH
jgi:thermolabile hemolysin